MNDPKLKLDPETHEYSYDGIPVPGVTGLLEKYGLVDYSTVPPDRLKLKQLIGSAVEDTIDLYDAGILNENSVDPLVAPYLLAWEKFCQVEKFVPISSQRMLFSKTYRFAGKPDKFGFLRGKDSMIDTKCTWAMYAAAGPQTAGYEILGEENLKFKIKGRYGVLLKPTHSFEVFDFNDRKQRVLLGMPEDPASDRSIFLSCLQLHHWTNTKRKGVQYATDRETQSRQPGAGTRSSH